MLQTTMQACNYTSTIVEIALMCQQLSKYVMQWLGIEELHYTVSCTES